MDQSKYLAAALRSMSETPQAQQPQMAQGQMRQGLANMQDPNAPKSIGDNLGQAWSNAKGAPGRFMGSFETAGQNLQGAPQRFQQSMAGLGQLFK